MRELQDGVVFQDNMNGRDFNVCYRIKHKSTLQGIGPFRTFRTSGWERFHEAEAEESIIIIVIAAP